MKSLAIVVQRYGPDVIGGSETHARLLAQKLAERNEVTILTTCAQDYRTWKNHYPPGESVIHRVRVLRWPTKTRRSWHRFGRLTTRTLRSPTPENQHTWLLKQGPQCPDLIDFIYKNRLTFDAFIFFTYLYYPTFFGLPLVAEKSILIPTAHDEPVIHLPMFRALFHLPRFIAFNTEEERALVHTLFRNQRIPGEVVGIGIDLHPVSHADDGYFLYAGRIERGKNCEELFDFAARARLPLKAIGPAQIRLPRHIEYLGVVDEEKKKALFQRCKALINPSHNESLSLVILEAWSHGKPVIVSAQSPILKAQVEQSQGGYAYEGFEDFRAIIERMDAQSGRRGRAYAEKRYSWSSVLQKYEAMLQNL